MDPIKSGSNKSAAPESLALAYASTLGNVYHHVRGADGYVFGGLTVNRRGNNDWLAVCKVTALDTMQKYVAFGAGVSYFEALTQLNKTIAVNHWKIDKPWPLRGR